VVFLIPIFGHTRFDSRAKFERCGYFSGLTRNFPGVSKFGHVGDRVAKIESIHSGQKWSNSLG
jgi:hypothetical protein